MTIDLRDAQNSLQDIAQVERRTREALYYAGSSSLLILWGVCWAAGHAITYVSPRHANAAWYAIDVLGIAASVLIGCLRSRARPRSWDWRIVGAFIVVMAFGLFAQWLLGHGQYREVCVFWAVLVMAGYIVAGLWIGRFFILCGSLVILLSLAGYVWSGPWFNLWMAGVGGGSLVLGGFWLRHRGAPG